MKQKLIIIVLIIVIVIFTGYTAYQVIIENRNISSQGIDYPIALDSEKTETSFISGQKSDENASDDSADLSTFKWEVEPMTKKDFVKMLLSYNKKIAYKAGGRRYDLNMPTYTYIFKEMDPKDYEGLDSLGFVDWAYRKVIGTSLESIEKPALLYENSKKITEDKLQIGDIGMTSLNDGEDDHYGIYVGTINSMPVFAHCSSNPTKYMEKGCLQFSYLKSFNDESLNNVSSVSFTYFFRPEVDWKTGDDIVCLEYENGMLQVIE